MQIHITRFDYNDEHLPIKWIFALHQESSHLALCFGFHPLSVLLSPIRVQNLFHRNQYEREEICDLVCSATRGFLTGHYTAVRWISD